MAEPIRALVEIVEEDDPALDKRAEWQRCLATGQRSMTVSLSVALARVAVAMNDYVAAPFSPR